MSVNTKRARDLALRQGVVGNDAEARQLLESLADEVDGLRKKNATLWKFVSYVMAHAFDGRDIDGGSAQDEAEHLELIELRPIPEEDSINGETEHYFLTEKAERILREYPRK